MKVFTHKPCDYEFSPLDVIEKDNKRFYGKDGVYYPSITTVLSEFPGKQEGLSNWREKVGVDEAAKITHVAGKRGTALHDLLELYLANKIKGDNFFIFHRPPINPDVVSMFKTIKPAVDLIDNITGLEVALYSHKYKFAGRVDVIGEYQGEPAIIDFKTSRKKKRTSWIEDYFCQATGYSLMWEEMTGTVINKIVVIMVYQESDVHYKTQVWERNRNNFLIPLMETRLKWKEIHGS